MRPPVSGRLEIGDLVVPGLTFRVTDKGVRSWSLLYRILGEGGETATGIPKRGKLRRLTLGRYPVLGLKGAREAARKGLELADAGQDPAAVRFRQVAEQQQALTQTVAKLVEQCLAKHYSKTRKYETAKAYLEGRVVSAWGDRPVANIKRRDAIALIDDLVAEDKPGAATDVLKYGRKLFNWAIDRELTDGPNPFDRLKAPKAQSRDRVLKPAEIAAVWNGSTEAGYPFGTLVQLLLLTGCRRTEIASMRWSWFDLEADTPHFEIPAEHYKSERAHVVPLSTKALALVKDLPRFRGGDYVLTTTHGRRPISGYSKMKRRLDATILRSGKIDPWCLHDLRRTVYTHLTGQCKVSEFIADRVLGHAMPGLQRVYNQYRYLDEKAAALETWANDLTTILGEASENVGVTGS